MDSNDEDDELTSHENLYRHLIEDCQRLLDGGGHESPRRTPQRCPCPTKTDRSGGGGGGGRVLGGTATRSCLPRARPPPVQKKTSAYRLPDCRPIGRGGVAATRSCGDCSRATGRDGGRGFSNTGPWSAVCSWASAAAYWTWSKKSYFFVAVASFALGVYADDYCQCMYESDY